MFNNPENIQNLVASNPFLQSIVQSNPQLAGMLNDPIMMQMLADPQIFNSMLSMVGGIEGVQTMLAGAPSQSSTYMGFHQRFSYFLNSSNKAHSDYSAPNRLSK